MGKLGNNHLKKDLAVFGYKLSYLLVFFLLKVWFFAVNNRDIVDPYDFTIALDNLIPFNKYFVVPYVYWYFYLAFGFLFFAIKDYKRYFHLLATIYIGETIAIIIYIIFPSTIQRPIIFENDIFSRLVDGLYKKDSHFNCLPSMHIYETIMISIYLLKYSKKTSMRIFVSISTIAISLSTLFMKQHAFLDVIASIILSIVVYYFVTYAKILNNSNAKKVLRTIIPVSIRYNFGDFRKKEKSDG